MSSFTVSTPHGLLSINDTALKSEFPALLLIHGNSSSSKIFRHIFDSASLSTRYRLVSFCLPGHGSSSRAPNPSATYHMRGYAEAALHILQHLNIESVVVFGWSLGGHIGIEMLSLLDDPVTFKEKKKIEIRGLMITGTPPALGEKEVEKAFTMGGGIGLAGERDWTDEVAQQIMMNSVAAGKVELFEQWMYEDARNTDGRARMLMRERFVDENAGGVDQVKVVEETEVLIAVVNGADEQFVNLEYLEGIRWKKLWKGKCLRLEGLHHAPFWEDPEGFDRILVEFMGDVEKES
ncbi:Alpha/Beta hydrolase protein [Phaeosphaeria sp. MPI-PUGE-AT-0046c]|nr:Alpha/Beta hydrolase protein [Phaeosphaeria sp. MPI-PUGE-AT-0046c]